MESIIHQLYRPYFSDLGLIQKNLPADFKRCGLYLEPDPEIGSGYCWIYPVGNLYAINIQHFMFNNDFAMKYGHPAFISIGSYGNTVAKIMYDDMVPNAENLLGYVGDEGLYSRIIDKNSIISSTGISLLPEFYEEYLPERFNIDLECIKNILTSLKGDISIPEVEILLKQIRSARPSPETANLFYESKILEIISLMLQWREDQNKTKLSSETTRQDMKNLQRVHDFIKMNHARPLTLDTMTDVACMSRSKLTSSFKRLYGLTIIEYIQKLRIETARELLVNSDYEIKKIALMVGYKHHASFSVLFKRSTGITPNDYRKQFYRTQYVVS